MTAREQLYKKLAAEYDAFIAELKGAAPDTILGRAYEKTFKEDILYSFEQDGAFSDKEIDVLLTVEKPLDELYQNWVDTDVSHMEDLSDSISGFAVREIERQNKTQSEAAAAPVLNGEVNAGDYVIAAPNNDYGHLVGQVIYIDKAGRRNTIPAIPATTFMSIFTLSTTRRGRKPALRNIFANWRGEIIVILTTYRLMT